jgi:hypothetical protein
MNVTYVVRHERVQYFVLVYRIYSVSTDNILKWMYEV